jgi:hypothetical protein
MELAAWPTRTRWRYKVELMKLVPLHIRVAAIFLKLLNVFLLTLFSCFLELSMKFFFIPVKQKLEEEHCQLCCMDCSHRTMTWPFVYHTECWKRDVASTIVRIIVIAIAWPFMHHSECWGLIVANSVV